MNCKFRIGLLFIFCLFLTHVSVGQGKNPDELFSGTWKGTSLCQVKGSPCHDEIVVYHISKTRKDGTLEIQANKIVGGQEEEMGVIQFRYDTVTGEIISISDPTAIWKFKMVQNKLEGTLHVRGDLYRIISLTKL